MLSYPSFCPSFHNTPICAHTIRAGVRGRQIGREVEEEKIQAVFPGTNFFNDRQISIFDARLDFIVLMLIHFGHSLPSSAIVLSAGQ